MQHMAKNDHLTLHHLQPTQSVTYVLVAPWSPKSKIENGKSKTLPPAFERFAVGAPACIMASMRADGRTNEQLRTVKVTRGFTQTPAGSVLWQQGNTVVLCTAAISPDLPPWTRQMGHDSNRLTSWASAGPDRSLVQLILSLESNLSEPLTSGKEKTDGGALIPYGSSSSTVWRTVAGYLWICFLS